MKNYCSITKVIFLLLTILFLFGCHHAENSHVYNNSTVTNDDQNETEGEYIDIYSGPGLDYLIEDKNKKVSALREYNNWYEVEYADNRRGYVKRDELKDVDVKKIEIMVQQLTVGPTERKELLVLNEDYTLTDEIDLRESPSDSSLVFGTVSKNEKIKIINLEPIKELSSALESIDRLRYWQIEALTSNGKVRGYVRSDDLFDYDNPLKGFDKVKEKNARISYNGNDYYSADGASIEGYLDNWSVENSLKIKDEHWSIIGAFVSMLGCDYNPEDLLTSKTVNVPTIEKGKKNYHNTSTAVDSSRKVPSNICNIANTVLDWGPAFCKGLYSSFQIDVELQKYRGERKIVLRIDSPVEYQNYMKYLGKTYELSELLIDSSGSAVGTGDIVDQQIRKAYPQLAGEKKYSMKVTFAKREACQENPFGYYLIIDKDLNVYTEMIIHSGTKAIIYYDRQPVYDATNDLGSLQKLDDTTSKGIIEFLERNGFTFTKTEGVAGSEQHVNAAQVAGEVNEEIVSLLREFVKDIDSMYGKSCTFTLTREEDIDNNTSFTRNWEGLSIGTVLGYSIEDFDNDNEDELLLITLADDYRLQLEMYEVINKEVTLADINNLDTGTSYGSVDLPCGRDSQQKICGLLSAFVTDSNHRIYLQSSEPGLLADGWETYIVSTEYKNNMFSDYKSSHAIGSSIEDSIPDKVQELLDMGVPNIDYDVYNNIFYRLAPLIDCFDGGVHEILHAEQYTTTVEKENSITKKIETETLFATKDGEISEPPEYTESEQESNVQAVSVEDFVNGFWMSLDELLAMFGEPDSSYTHRFQYYYIFENIECLGNNGRLSCRVGEDNMVYSVAWHSYELNQDLFNSLVGKANESITMTPDPYAEDPLNSVKGQKDNNEIFITYSEAESTTSIQWSYD